MSPWAGAVPASGTHICSPEADNATSWDWSGVLPERSRLPFAAQSQEGVGDIRFDEVQEIERKGLAGLDRVYAVDWQ